MSSYIWGYQTLNGRSTSPFSVEMDCHCPTTWVWTRVSCLHTLNSPKQTKSQPIPDINGSSTHQCCLARQTEPGRVVESNLRKPRFRFCNVSTEMRAKTTILWRSSPHSFGRRSVLHSLCRDASRRAGSAGSGETEERPKPLNNGRAVKFKLFPHANRIDLSSANSCHV